MLGRVCLLVATLVASVQAQCTDVHLVFARGTGESAGLGMCGNPLASSLAANLPGKTFSAYAVKYKADTLQTGAGAGATDMTNHLVSVAASCPNTKFVIGGYSQGASVTDIAIGIPTILGVGKTIPTSLAPRIKAVVTFGNPLKLAGGTTIAKASKLYGPKSIDYCNKGDPICANGLDVNAHLAYPKDGSVTNAALRAAVFVLTT